MAPPPRFSVRAVRNHPVFTPRPVRRRVRATERAENREEPVRMSQAPQTQVTPTAQATEGLSIRRHLTTAGQHPYDAIEWEIRDARIGHGGKVSFEQRGVEFPKSWSQNATNIVAQKYFRGQLGSASREHSVKQMIGRVAGTIAGWGRERGYFATDADADVFEAELIHI